MRKLIEFVASQSLFVDKETEETLFWYSPKRTEELYSEIGGELEEVVCDLNNEDERVETSDFSAVLTRCTWKNMRKS